MKKVSCLLLLVVMLSAFNSKPRQKVLIFSLTRGFHHASIADGIIAIKQIGDKEGFEVDTTTNPAIFTDANLKQYKALIFLSPTGDALFNADQQQAFVNFIHNGGGFVGIHAATDCLYDWPWYGKLVGAYFVKHPKIQQAQLQVLDHKHLSTKILPSNWQHTDEWYNFKDVSDKLNVLVKIDEKSYEGGTMGEEHPISWYQKYEGGKIFYTALGHTADDFRTDTLFLKHLTGGIKYALGQK